MQNQTITSVQKETLINSKKENEKQNQIKPNINNLPIQKNKKINKHKKKKQQEIIYKNLNPFKQMEKHFKLYQDKQTDFSIVYNPEHQNNLKSKFQILGYTVYELPTPEDGAFLVKSFNSDQIVNKIGYLGLNQFFKRPYRTNLNSRQELYEEKVQDKNQKTQQDKPKQLLQDIPVTQQQFNSQIKQKGYCFNDKIRWANVGHQYDWTLRKYPQYHTPMHPAISSLTDRANLLYNTITHQKRQYYPQSAIVNYYGLKDYMTGHLDDAQYDQQSPIYSFSFGISSIFLMGGMTKDQKPLAVRLDSGDLLIMAKGSRKCYHGVPRVIQGSYQKKQIKQEYKANNVPHLYNSPQNVEKYFETHRININIRQAQRQKKGQRK